MSDKANLVRFSTLTDTEKQAFAEYLLKEKFRHREDIDRIDQDLHDLLVFHNISPTGKFIDKWIEVKE